MTTDFGIDNVRVAILKQAVADYIQAYCGTKVGQVDTKVTLAEVEKFFYSPWFGTITDEKIDPDAAWCNQPSMFKTCTFRELAIKRGTSKTGEKGASWKALEMIEEMLPEIAKKYFDFKGKRTRQYEWLDIMLQEEET